MFLKLHIMDLHEVGCVICFPAAAVEISRCGSLHDDASDPHLILANNYIDPSTPALLVKYHERWNRRSDARINSQTIRLKTLAYNDIRIGATAAEV
ncbi:hypothetical protein ACI7YU_18730 [Pseudomonas siliginis]|uniref:hypothetical protein n=1 Tax=Pseudomonas siliginis TaxID=2842346 RepID=UPI003866E5A1